VYYLCLLLIRSGKRKQSCVMVCCDLLGVKWGYVCIALLEVFVYVLLWILDKVSRNLVFELCYYCGSSCDCELN